MSNGSSRRESGVVAGVKTGPNVEDDGPSGRLSMSAATDQPRRQTISTTSAA